MKYEKLTEGQKKVLDSYPFPRNTGKSIYQKCGNFESTLLVLDNSIALNVSPFEILRIIKRFKPSAIISYIDMQ